MNKGKIIVISAPSGSGKSTIIESVIKDFKDLKFSISATTRKPRGNEKHGKEYFFLSREKFEDKIASDEFVEYKNVYGNLYGTLKSYIDECIGKGESIIFDVDVKGALTIKEKYPESVMIFIYPPSMEELESRLFKRGVDDKETIRKRLTFAKGEIDLMGKYDFTVENDKLDKAINDVKSIFVNILK